MNQIRQHKTLSDEFLTDRVTRICTGVSAWLENEEGLLEASVNRTVSERLFASHDVRHMLDHIARTVTPETLAPWLEKVRDSQAAQHPGNAVSEAYSQHHFNVLCLHAGNLPMVGLQDVIAALLSNARYHGKLSVRDPWLLDGLLKLLQKQLPDNIVSWSTSLDDFKGILMDRILFAGSEASVSPVTIRLEELGISTDTATENTRFLNRTARFSLAFLSDMESREILKGLSAAEMLNDLVEAIMRYEGRGCRSVAAVVSPNSLSDMADALIPALQAYADKYPVLHPIKPGRTYWTSYLKAVGHVYFEAGHMLLTDDTDLLGKEDVVCWIPGDVTTVQQLSDQLGAKVQNIYMKEKATHFRTDILSNAQTPPVDWQPDGVDVLHWLLT